MTPGTLPSCAQGGVSAKQKQALNTQTPAELGSDAMHWLPRPGQSRARAAPTRACPSPVSPNPRAFLTALLLFLPDPSRSVALSLRAPAGKPGCGARGVHSVEGWRRKGRRPTTRHAARRDPWHTLARYTLTLGGRNRAIERLLPSGLQEGAGGARLTNQVGAQPEEAPAGHVPSPMESREQRVRGKQYSRILWCVKCACCPVRHRPACVADHCMAVVAPWGPTQLSGVALPCATPAVGGCRDCIAHAHVRLPAQGRHHRHASPKFLHNPSS